MKMNCILKSMHNHLKYLSETDTFFHLVHSLTMLLDKLKLGNKDTAA